ncbi:MAG: hypothetical protein ISR87_10545 [Candidatus Marinimicrobia bacterium]|nr:hypothetical protein [FCB group bacterium]MBL7025884.1 hypothetical protein [Candidatus Neomarinimicrobiota bacterium]
MIKINTDKILRFITRPLEVVILRYIFVFMLAAPLVMYLLWVFSSKHELEIVIVNKSVTDDNNMELHSLNWILNHERIVNKSQKFYNPDSDYYGFYPRLGGDFSVRDFQSYDSLEISDLVNQSDLLYLTDSYGVYTHDYGVDADEPNRLLYGGFNQSDLEVLKEFRAQKKLVVSEFSLFTPPTGRSMRDSLQVILGIKWSGWTGRYFLSLDSTAHGDLPEWVVNLYHEKYGVKWPFFDSGIVLVRWDDIVILEYGTHLVQEAPIIETQAVYAQTYGLPPSIQYPFWFDIVSSPERDNQIISIYHLEVNERGDSLLSAHNIPKIFPAVLKASTDEYPFYYFAGDFSDNPVIPPTAYFKGIERFHKFFYNDKNVEERQQFFWRYYRPLISNILRNEVKHLKR